MTIYGCYVYPEAYAWIMGYNIEEITKLITVLFAWDVLDIGYYTKATKYYIHPDIPPKRLSLIKPEAVIPWDVETADLPTDPSPFLESPDGKLIEEFTHELAESNELYLLDDVSEIVQL